MTPSCEFTLICFRTLIRNRSAVSHPPTCFLSSCSYTVARRQVHAVNSINTTKSEFSNRRGEALQPPQCTGALMHHSEITLTLRIHFSPPPGFEAAQMFLRSGEVPDAWKMDMSQILDSSSSDDDEDDEEEKESDEDEEDEDEKKKKKHIKEEVRV